MNLTDIEDITFEFRFCSIYYVDVDAEILLSFNHLFSNFERNILYPGNVTFFL